jgi:hypothetical protein
MGETILDIVVSININELNSPLKGQIAKWDLKSISVHGIYSGHTVYCFFLQ